MSQSFNFEQALKDLQSGKDLTGKDGVLMPLIKRNRLIIKVIPSYC